LIEQNISTYEDFLGFNIKKNVTFYVILKTNENKFPDSRVKLVSIQIRGWQSINIQRFLSQDIWEALDLALHWGIYFSKQQKAFCLSNGQHG